MLSWNSRKGAARFVDDITSGKVNARQTVPGIMGMFDPQVSRNWFHVESQAIAIMRAEKVRLARLVINNPAVCPMCRDPSMAYKLPKNYQLVIENLDGQVLHRIIGKGVLR